MSWSISVFRNTLRMSPETAEKLIRAADDHGHVVSYDDSSGISFDQDAMEHMDFLWDSWSKKVLSDPSVSGEVVFTSTEGDNAGKFWGYKFIAGESVPVRVEVNVVLKEI